VEHITADQVGERFRRAARERGFVLDAAQEHAVDRLAELGARAGRRRRLPHRAEPRGLYLWGPVGRGKSWLLDTFFEAVALPPERRRRVHFHAFFRQLHEAVRRHRDAHSWHAVDAAVSELAHGVELLCFDEFHVHDPGDAMLVTRLLHELHARKVLLVSTSNYPPAGLLPNPLPPTPRRGSAGATSSTCAATRTCACS
jgi:cell division protein ZapE